MIVIGDEILSAHRDSTCPSGGATDQRQIDLKEVVGWAT